LAKEGAIAAIFGVGKAGVVPQFRRVSRLPLEDNFTDIIGKAQRGLGIDDAKLASLTGLSTDAIAKLKDGEANDAALRTVAPHLNLDAAALVALARKQWYPEIPRFSDGFAMFTTPYEDMTVNSYLVWDPATLDAAAVDTGATCDGLLGVARDFGLTIRMILLTHTHEDHIADLPHLREETDAPNYLSSRGSLPGVIPAEEGFELKLGSLRIRTLHTYGHADDGSTFVVDGLAHPLAFVGDSLFASSMGGSMTHYRDAFRNNIEKIFKLPDETVLASGHGPLTTVGQERKHNPFFASHFA
jgi:glyoxylase-like metal-dependent hydrolase (beta-lactamase superfamily II)